jgi:hypothetical protein
LADAVRGGFFDESREHPDACTAIATAMEKAVRSDVNPRPLPTGIPALTLASRRRSRNGAADFAERYTRNHGRLQAVVSDRSD